MHERRVKEGRKKDERMAKEGRKKETKRKVNIVLMIVLMMCINDCRLILQTLSEM
jgi:hypothetical protein